MSELVLDPAKQYAELYPGTNQVMRIFQGETIPEWAMFSGRRIYEIPEGVTVSIGDRYQNGEFSPVPPPLTFDQRAELEVDGLRLLFELNYDQESRLRVLEGRPAITKLQYKNALITRWKELNQ